MKQATEIFEKHWVKATGKPLDETTKQHMKYDIEAVDEALKKDDILSNNHRPKYPTLTRFMAYNVGLINQYMND